MSIFAFTCDDAAAVLTIAEGVDNSDAYSGKIRLVTVSFLRKEQVN